MYELIIATSIVLVFSAICSGTEVALFSISYVKAEQLYLQKKCSKLFITLIKERDEFVSTLVVLNNIVNIAGSMIVGGIALNTFGSGIKNVIFTIFLTTMIIIFAEILPKSVGSKKSKEVVDMVARPLSIAKWVLSPLVAIITLFTNSIIKLIFGVIEEEAISENEIEYLARTGAKCSKSEIRKNEAELIQKVFNLYDTTAKEIMTPRTALTWISSEEKLNDAIDKVKSSQHSRIVVIGETIDDVVGIALKQKLLIELSEGKGNLKIKELEIDELKVVSRKTSAEALLSIFKREKKHIAAVQDEHGGLSGIVTLEDVLEILVGEIVDETDTVEDMRDVSVAQKIQKKIKAKLNK